MIFGQILELQAIVIKDRKCCVKSKTYCLLFIFSTKFLDSVILTLYNFGANQREEYLLLRLFKTALEEEVMKKVDKISDIVSGNPMVIKMIVGFYKSGSGQVALRHSIYIRTVSSNRLLFNCCCNSI